MLQLFAKTKIAVAIVAIVLFSTILFLISGITVTGNRRLVFPGDGYVLSYEDGADSTVVADQVRFASGDSVSSTSIGTENFLHFDDESLSSLGGMTLVDLSNYSDGLMDSYYLGSRQILSKSEGIYRIDNNNSTLEFENFLLKTGDQSYLMYSPTISLQQNNRQPNNISDGFVEIEYLDDNDTVARLSDGQNVWQFLADGSTVTLQNGAVLDLGSMELTSAAVSSEVQSPVTSLGDIEVNVNVSGNISVSSTSAEAWEAPVFILNAIDGTDGTSGESGVAGNIGEDGEDGEDGENGEDGIDGEDGTSGTKGSAGAKGVDQEPGKDGANSSDGEEEEEKVTVKLDPRVSISYWLQDSGSFSFKLLLYNAYFADEEDEAERYRLKNLNAYLLEVSTGKIIYEWNQTALGVPSEPEDGEYIPTEYCTSLSPSSSYKFVVQGDILKTDVSSDSSNNRTYGKTILLSRTFKTDANGFYLQKVDSAYLSTAAQKVSYMTKYSDSVQKRDVDYFPINGSYSFIGLEPVVSGGQTIESIEDVTITYKDLTTGEEGEDTELPLTAEDTKHDEWSFLTSLAQAGLPYPLSNLRSNTEYTISMTVNFSNGKQSKFSETYLTLKATPSGGTTEFDVNSERYFISSLNKKPSDPDGAIEYYTHELYLYDDGENELTGDSLRTKSTTKVSDPTVYYYLDNAKVIEGRLYGSRIYVTWYDNEKYVTLELDQMNNWSAQSIQSSTHSYIQLQNERPGANSYSMTLHISPGGGNQKIYVGKRDVHRLMIQISCAKSTTVQYYTSLKEWTNSKGEYMTTDTEIPFTGASLAMDLTNLFDDTVYTITVSGCMDEESGTMETIGTTTFVTEQSN